MAYLDVAPMMTALRTTPDQFEFTQGWLQHIPSRHSFQFDAQGHVRILANCNCSQLSVASDQEAQLYSTFQDWQRSYWRPYQINKEFASHFDPPSFVRRVMIEAAARLHRWLVRGGQRRVHNHAPIGVPAE